MLEDEIGPVRRYETHSEEPRQHDAPELAPPELLLFVAHERLQAEVPRDEEHDRHDEDVRPADEHRR